MKKISLLILIATVLSFSNTQAQTRSKVVAPISQGASGILGNLPNTITGHGTADTLAVTDTIAYIFQVPGSHRFLPFLSVGWTKIGSGTATVTASFYQGNTPYNFISVKAGSANTAYTKTLTFSSSGTSFVDFLADSAKISGKYLKIQYVTSNTANVQGSIVTNVNTIIQ